MIACAERVSRSRIEIAIVIVAKTRSNKLLSLVGIGTN
jgi:hypothetical protein